MSFITLQSLHKSFGATQVVQAFDLSLEKGEFVSLLGPSGCGKTTVLRMVAGFETPDRGDIVIGGESVLRKPANQRRIGMVFQSYALFPNLTVSGNVDFGLRVAGMAKAERARRVGEMLELVGLSGLRDRFPWQLSGGQQQRVALARAIAPRPQVLLLDEPLSALDAKIRVSLRTEIRSIQRELGITTLFVTHDQEEALSMSDRIVVMNGGRSEQIGTPQQVYDRPATRFVAGFIGTLNLIEGQATRREGRMVCNSVAGQVPLPDTAAEGPIAVAIRPQALRPCAPGQGHLTGTLRQIEFLGAFTRLHVACAGMTVQADCFARDLPEGLRPDQPIGLRVLPTDCIVIA